MPEREHKPHFSPPNLTIHRLFSQENNVTIPSADIICFEGFLAHKRFYLNVIALEFE